MKRRLDELAEIAQKAVLIGNDLIKNTRPRIVTEKSDRDTYTDVDVRIEHSVRAYLTEATPEIGFIGEEEGDINGNSSTNSHYWVLDPIDGTANFVHDIPLSAISLALLSNGNAITASVSLPHFDLQYTATSGQGAFVNGAQITSSSRTKLSNCIVSIGDYATGNDAYQKNARRLEITARLAAHAERVRMFGSAAHDLVWTADGRIDATVIMSNSTIDVAAGILIAREAGVCVIDELGKEHSPESQSTIAVNKHIKEELLLLIDPNRTD